MRALKIVGVEADGAMLVCEDIDSQERFSLTVDEDFKAAATGELAKARQNELRYDYSLTPKEIQQRIRSGHSVTEVATIASMPEEKILRFAHPVLLERARVAEMALAAHPVRKDGPAENNLGAITTQSLLNRNANPEEAQWDAWKNADNTWQIQLRWQTGRSVNTAHWRFTPGSHGGTVVEDDSNARLLSDPTYNDGIRAVGSPRIKSIPADTFDFDAVRPESETLNFGDSDVVYLANPTAASTHDRTGRHPAVPAWEDVLLGVRSAQSR